MRWLAAVAALTVFAARPARGEEKMRLVLLADSGAELAQRLRAEAKQLGIELVEASPSTSTPPAIVAQRYAAAGVIRIASSTTIELWLFVPDGARSEVVRAEPNEGESFALRVVEEIRAGLIQLRTSLSNKATQAERPSESLPGPKEANARVALGSPTDAGRTFDETTRRKKLIVGASAGVGASIAAGGMGATLHAALALRTEPFAGWIGKAEALLPLTENAFSAPEGSANARPFLFLGAVDRVVWNAAPGRLRSAPAPALCC